ncbi:hypothetical protein [Parasphingorhabdus pacifica]
MLGAVEQLQAPVGDLLLQRCDCLTPRMHASGDYTIIDLTELFSVSRPTVYRTLQRDPNGQAR